MVISLLINFIHIGNVGIVKEYVYVFCSLAAIIAIYYCMKPIIQWAVKLELSKLLIYFVSSILLLLSIISISHFIDEMDLMSVIKFTLQSIAIFGAVLSMSILILRYIRNTN